MKKQDFYRKTGVCFSEILLRPPASDRPLRFAPGPAEADPSPRKRDPSRRKRNPSQRKRNSNDSLPRIEPFQGFRRESKSFCNCQAPPHFARKLASRRCSRPRSIPVRSRCDSLSFWRRPRPSRPDRQKRGGCLAVTSFSLARSSNPRQTRPAAGGTSGHGFVTKAILTQVRLFSKKPRQAVAGLFEFRLPTLCRHCEYPIGGNPGTNWEASDIAKLIEEAEGVPKNADHTKNLLRLGISVLTVGSTQTNALGLEHWTCYQDGISGHRPNGQLLTTGCLPLMAKVS